MVPKYALTYEVSGDHRKKVDEVYALKHAVDHGLLFKPLHGYFNKDCLLDLVIFHSKQLQFDWKCPLKSSQDSDCCDIHTELLLYSITVDPDAQMKQKRNHTIRANDGLN